MSDSGSGSSSSSTSSRIDTDNIFESSKSNNADNADNAAIPETSSNNINDIVETLYSNETTTSQQSQPPQLIGYSCKKVTEQNTVEKMDLIFYMDVLSPINKGSSSTGTENENENTNSENENDIDVLDTIQETILHEMSIIYQINPIVSKGLRCFDLPVDGSTWIVEMYIDSTSSSSSSSSDANDFNEISLFGGCRELEWDKEKQNCKFYEVHLHGSYIGAVTKDEKYGSPFGDVIAELESLIDGPKLVQALSNNNNNNNNFLNDDDSYNYFDTSFIGVPRAVDDPNFQGGGDEQYGRDELIDPVNIKTDIESSESIEAPNRKTITVVGGLLVGCFSIAFILIGYVLYQRRQSYTTTTRNDNCGRGQDNTGLAILAGTGSSPEDDDIDSNEFDDDGVNGFARHYNLDQGDEDEEDNNNNNNNRDEQGGDHEEQNYDEGESNNNNNNKDEIFQDDEPTPPTKNNGMTRMMQQQQQHHLPQEEEYLDLPMSTEAIRMDLGNSLKGQLMGLHGSTNNIITNNNATVGPYGDGTPINLSGGGSTGTGITGNKRGMIGPGGSYNHHHNHHHQNAPPGGGGNGGLFNRNSTQPTSVDGNESDDVDSWAQTDGTIGSLELQLEPITAEV